MVAKRKTPSVTSPFLSSSLLFNVLGVDHTKDSHKQMHYSTLYIFCQYAGKLLYLIMSTMDSKIRGVNLGGWLILERWITPSVFADSTAKDESSLMQENGAAERIEQHRQTFISEADFAWLEANGVNAVRIPVGYWLFDGDPPYTACAQYLDWAMTMAEKYNLRVLIDLHGVKGSQNGKDHSGKIGESGWFKKRAYQRETIVTLRRLAERYQDSPALWGIELINEPSLGPIKYFMLLRFYRESYRELVTILRPDTRVVFSDGFVPWLFTGALRRIGGYPPVMAVHWYQFGRTRIERYFAKLARRPIDIARLQRAQPVIIGEWSGMLSHETLEDIPQSEQRRLEAVHIQRQLEAYAEAEGWFYWTYKTEGASIWSFREQVGRGVLLLER